MKHLLFALLLATMACGGITTTGGVINLYQVDPGVYRSGQPTTAAGWAYLKGLGIKHVVKLNFTSEGGDQGAIDVGMDVLYVPIQPDGDLASIVDLPDSANIFAAAKAMQQGNVDLHCLHGQDRTGLVSGVFRVLYDGWTKDRAFSEMLSRGFHVELVGLDSWWGSWDGKTGKQ